MCSICNAVFDKGKKNFGGNIFHEVSADNANFNPRRFGENRNVIVIVNKSMRWCKKSSSFVHRHDIYNEMQK